MPLATYFNNMWYGSASGATFGDDNATTVVADIQGYAQPDSTITSTGIVFDADATRLVNSPATIESIGIIATASPKMRARPTATISIGSRPTAEDIAQAVWGSIAASLNTTGTMGEKLNGAGSAGNPWTTDLSSYNTANTAGKILRDAADSAELASIK
jgi:hypothetical protein